MGEEKTYQVNDTNRAIGRVIDNLRTFDSTSCDSRVKALVLTKLEEAQLWSLKLIKSNE